MINFFFCFSRFFFGNSPSRETLNPSPGSVAMIANVIDSQNVSKMLDRMLGGSKKHRTERIPGNSLSKREVCSMFLRNLTLRESNGTECFEILFLNSAILL